MRASYFDTSPMVNPRPVRRDRKPLVVRAIVVFAIVVVGALVFRFLRPSPGTPNTASNTPTTKSVPASPSLHADPADPVARGRLLSRLPPGYPSGTCEPVAPPGRCAGDAQLRKEHRRGWPAVVDVHVGARQSPPGWDFRRHRWRLRRRNCLGKYPVARPIAPQRDPQETSGTLICGLQQGVPMSHGPPTPTSWSARFKESARPQPRRAHARWSTHS
jgi:hypothetical protein